MSIEFGIFSDEGCVEAGFYSREAAATRAAAMPDNGPEIHIAEICPDHEEREREFCEECNVEDAKW